MRAVAGLFVKGIARGIHVIWGMVSIRSTTVGQAVAAPTISRKGSPRESALFSDFVRDSEPEISNSSVFDRRPIRGFVSVGMIGGFHKEILAL